MTEEEKTNQTTGAGEQKKEEQDRSMIELDGTVESAVPKPSDSEEHKHEKKLSPRELKHKRELEHKARLKAEKEQLRKIQRELNPGGEKKKKMVMLVCIAAVFIILLGGFSVVYFKFPHLIPGKSLHKSNILIDESTIIIDTVYEDSLVDLEEIPDMEMSETNTEIKPAKKVSRQNKEAVKQTQKKAAGNGKLSTPCWIISFASISSENKASKEVKNLVDKGYLSGYYWIPDYDASGKRLFKVYVGPFASKAEGREKLQAIQSLSPTAYLMKLQ